MKPISLSLPEADQLISVIPTDFTQARRMVEYLAKSPNATTQEVAASCSIGNLSDVARKANPHLYPLGVMISCQRPPAPIHNRFGEPSGMFFWGLYKVQAAANDADYGSFEGADDGVTS